MESIELGVLLLKKIKILFLTAFCGIFLLLCHGKAELAGISEMPLLKQGASGEAVYILQSELNKLGFLQSDADGNFGTLTQKAVTNFQITAGLEADGIVGAGTWQALRDYHQGEAVSRAKVETRLGTNIALYAKKYIGVPYVWGGTGSSGFDCSGFIYFIYNHFGIDLPRTADSQYGIGRQVSLSVLEPGDLVFFSTYEPGPSHVGIYVGNNQFVHASSGAGEVTVTPMSKPYYQDFLGHFVL